MPMASRLLSSAPATEVEITVLDRLRPDKDQNLQKPLSCYILKIARLADIVLGATIATDTYG